MNPDQPLFSLASTNLSAETSSALLAPLLRQRQTEVKYAKLKSNNKGQQDLLEFFSSPELNQLTAKVMLADKRYYLITHIVDKLIEPPLHEAGHDLYAGDAHVGLVNVWYYTGHTIFPHGHWDKIMRAFVKAIRERNRAAYHNFDVVLSKAALVVPLDSQVFATGLLLARGRLDEFIGEFGELQVFDPALDIFIGMINMWMAVDPNQLHVTHDRSKPLRRNEKFLRAMMTPIAPRIIGYGNRQAELPLRVSHFDFGDSNTHSQLQVADLIAGASIDCLLAWSGRRACSAYHNSMRETNLCELFNNGMLPSPHIERINEPGKGERNLVNGSAEFMQEIEYWKSPSIN